MGQPGFGDAFGRLVTVHDTLDTGAHTRDISISYNPMGLIESVTDFNGRTVSYEYYGVGEAGGSYGDLKSVTTPAIGHWLVTPAGRKPSPACARVADWIAREASGG